MSISIRKRIEDVVWSCRFFSTPPKHEMTVLWHFQNVFGTKHADPPFRFKQICSELQLCREDYHDYRDKPWRQTELREHMIKLAIQGALIYTELPVWEPRADDYQI